MPPLPGRPFSSLQSQILSQLYRANVKTQPFQLNQPSALPPAQLLVAFKISRTSQLSIQRKHFAVSQLPLSAL